MAGFVSRNESSDRLLAIVTENTPLSWWVPFEIGVARETDSLIATFLEVNRVSTVKVELPSYLKQAAEKLCCLPRAENCPTINAVLSRVLNELIELAYHMPNAAETVEAQYTAAERLTFLPQPARSGQY